ncbi:TetR/AcrR family transcriptional regulator [Mycolicibacterium celeriflavum]|uniref:TetR/AcrR family transcriptional regulator n=1 Tax=Mycolicibacterium celeriflavum TaxID=1249101 RepID=UPI003CEA22A7
MSAEDTRMRLLEAAQRLFAKGGEEATSLRAVTREAGANVASVHYHFGGRDGLLREVLNQHVAPINSRRLALLDAAVRETSNPSLHTLAEAFVRPDLETLARLRDEEPQLARFVGRAYSQPSPAVAEAVTQQFAAMAERFLPLLAARLPELDDEELGARMDMVVALITSLFARATPVGIAPPLRSEDLETQVARLISMVVGILSSPSTPSKGGPDENAAPR